MMLGSPQLIQGKVTNPRRGTGCGKDLKQTGSSRSPRPSQLICFVFSRVFHICSACFDSCCCQVTAVVSDSVRPHRQQPTRLPRPRDFPGKNTGVGCHFLLHCMKVKSESEVAQSCPTLVTPWTAAHQAPPSMGFSRQEYWSGVPLPSLIFML